MKAPYNYGVRIALPPRPNHARRIRAIGTKRIIRCKAVAAVVCPGPVIADRAYIAFFNNIAPRRIKKGLRASDNGFTTKH